ncbi:unnamed protein product [Miscanthus lutarioriparius]|uniref:Uncharacterized protein n=1 Tax=Miscanthus lutarioriparius TaxID=422564 RepID=A0A811P7T7_9POAL|nr:unnamed protein product [Miscanthus lutarioriparius]
MGDTGFALLVALLASLAALLLVLLGAVILRHCCWRRRDAVSHARRGFVLFDVCFADDRQRRAVRPPPSSSMERGRGWRSAGAGEGREHPPGCGGEAAAADDQVEPDEFEIARWKKIFGGPNRSLSTIDEGTEEGGTTPSFCTPPGSPDRRDARALDMETVAVQLRQA